MLAGLRVGISPGYSYSSGFASATNFEKIRMPGIDSGLRMLLPGRIDVTLANRYVVLNQADRMGVTDKIELSDVAISGGPVYLAFRRGIPEDLVEAFSTALAQYKRANLITERPSNGL
ncbi:hypothetical protein QQF73_16260 [Marinobacter sp. M216]|uniref:Solute-binding protein family 3/N-terminal domain-containing protein n=1 Tax=Marinobacter albus TaxID=3030833 RepID=A0ABT7HGR6_9GAMM|nr:MULTISPECIES: transporter substrate-binding domain-containing protein [unclassified Marinobacter]MBW7472636.1 hypothetical protein [Marinobacter sp. F4218]MDK9559189.1 hypothetical protein [Marinobacter sp. M216]